MPGGFGERGIEGKVEAIRFARERGIPFFGICLGMQCAVIEFARNVVGLDGANSTEFDKDTPHPVICLLDEQKTITDKGGTMRLGAQPAKLEPGSVAATCYGKTEISERHRHRYEFNNAIASSSRPTACGSPAPAPTVARRNDRAARPSLVPGGAVSSGVQVEADGAAPAVRRLHRRGGRTQQGPRRAHGGEEARDEGTAGHARGSACIVVAVAMADEKKIIIDEDWKSQVEAEKEQAAKAKSAPAERRPTTDADSSEAADPPMPPASFEMLLTTLATEALVALGQVPHPVTGKVEVQRNQAKFLIDTVDVLRQKTAGNLTNSEQQVIDSLLHQMRLVFVADGRCVARRSPA